MRVNRKVPSIGLGGILIFSSLSVAGQNAPAHESQTLKLADVAFRQGYAARQQGNLQLARAKFAEAVKLQPKIAEAREALGAVLLELGKPTEAIAEMEAAAKLKPQDESIQSNLALAFANTGNPRQGDPALRGGHSNRQRYGTGSGRDSYARCLCTSLGCRRATGRSNSASSKKKKKRSPATMRTLRTPSALYMRSSLFGIKTQERFEHAIQLDGSYPKARIHLGVALSPAAKHSPTL